MNRHVIVVTAACGSLIPCLQSFGQIEVLFNQIAGHPKALVPAGAGLPAGTEFFNVISSGFDRPYASPDGTKFFFTGRANVAVAEDECYIVVNGASASTVAREGTAFGSPTADLLGIGDQRMGINDAGQFVFGVDTNAATTVDRFIIKWDGAAFVVAAREGDGVPGAATETWGNSLNSGHIRADGTAMFVGADTAGTLPGVQDDFCMVGNTILIQTGNAIGSFAWDAFNTSDFWVTPDGAHWMMTGDDTNPATTQDRILVMDGAEKMREGTILPGSGFTSNVSASFGSAVESVLLNDGSYMVHGSNVDTIDWAYRNGVVVAKTDDPIIPASTELFDDAIFTTTFFTVTGNAVGDYIVGGTTNSIDLNKNAILVLNGTEVVMREGDPVDLNGNGLEDDDAFVSVFNDDDCFLTDDLKLVFFANVRNAALASLGQMVLRKDLNQPLACPADIAPPGGDDVVNVQDLLAVIAAWGACVDPKDCPADIAPPGGDDVVNVQDLLAVIAAWGACP